MTKKLWGIFFIGLLSLAIVGVVVFSIYKELNKGYTDKDFGITFTKSEVDKNNNGIDDYTDILNGAKKFIKDKPPYKSKYYVGGYPTDKYAVCTDIIWYAMKNAGYDLKTAVDTDIAANTKEYFETSETPDPNIDFRRVRNLDTFFTRNALSLTLDTKDIKEWQAGDIVVFDNSHIGITSDKRNKDGIPYIIHQSPHKKGEEDKLCKYPIKGHYRITKDYKCADKTVK